MGDSSTHLRSMGTVVVDLSTINATAEAVGGDYAASAVMVNGEDMWRRGFMTSTGPLHPPPQAFRLEVSPTGSRVTLVELLPGKLNLTVLFDRVPSSYYFL